MDRKKFFIVLTIVFVLLLGVVGVFAFNEDLRNGLISTLNDTVVEDATGLLGGRTEGEGEEDVAEETPNKTPDSEETDVEDPQEEVKPRAEDNLKVYIPNTAGNFVVLVSGGEAMLIDGGLGSDEDLIREYLRDYLKIEHFKYIVVTNYHDDSVEGIKKIMSYNSTDYIFISNNVSTNKNSKDLRSYIEGRGLTWTVPSDNAQFKLGDTKFKFFTTHDGGSLITYLENGKDSFVFTSSITKFDDSVVSKLPEGVDIYSMTESSTVYSFPTKILDRLKPKTVIFNDRKGIDPTETIKRISTYETDMYRATQSKNIVIGSNGSSIIIDTKVPWR